MTNTISTINNFNPDTFLSEYWQKKPLLIRNAFPSFENPVTADELAGLSCEPDIESRIISAVGDKWELQQGPFTEESYNHLPENNWTLLVQAVDHIVPEVTHLLDYFNFIPNWRIDDVMVSYATKGGSVGPHYDNYDVFLLQGAGQRLWQIGSEFNADSTLVENSDLRLVDNFVSIEEWTLEAGDMLYLPPLVSHWGIALNDECMTYSMGFRAPAYAELLSDFCDNQIALLSSEQRYSDPDIVVQSSPGEITPEAIKKVKSILASQLSDNDAISEWFGRYVTEPKYEISEQMQAPLSRRKTSNEWLEIIKQVECVYRDPSSRISFIGGGELVTAFVNGTSFTKISRVCIEFISSNRCYRGNQIYNLFTRELDKAFLAQLFNQENLFFDHDLFD